MKLLTRINTRRVLSSLTEFELAIEDSCRELEVDSSTTYFITLAISEMASNIIRHGEHDSRVNDDMNMEIFSVDGSLKIVLEDFCKPLPKAVVQELLERDGSIAPYDTRVQNIPESGWGLDLINHAASSISYARLEARNSYELVFRTDTGAS